MIQYDCMSPDELALWRESKYAEANTPCIDCPLEFHLSERAAGRCFREKPYEPPIFATRPKGTRGPAPVYRTELERKAARRDTWRSSKRRIRGVQS